MIASMTGELLELANYQQALLLPLIVAIKELPVTDIDEYFASMAKDLGFIVTTTRLIEKGLV